MKFLTFVAAAALFPFAAAAHDGMAIKDAYARGGNAVTGGAFMVLENHREVDCTLKSVTSDVAERVELHTSKEIDGIMKMQPIEDGITIPAEGEHQFERGGDHVMFMGLGDPLEDGQSVKLSLDFGDCGIEEIEVPVDNKRTDSPGAAADDAGHDSH